MGQKIKTGITTCEKKKGFVPVEGCFKNDNILKSVTNNQRKKKKDNQIVFLDLAKAFDTVMHDSIMKALYKKRISLEVIDGIMDMYRQAISEPEARPPEK